MKTKLKYFGIAIGLLVAVYFANVLRQRWELYRDIKSGDIGELMDKKKYASSTLNSGLVYALELRQKSPFLDLLRKGADPNATVSDRGHKFPILFRSVSLEDDYWAQMLIDFGAKIDFLGPLDTTPLGCSIINDRPLCAARLIKAGADVNLASRNSLPLAQSASMRRPEIFELLILYGAEINEPYFKDATFFERYWRMGWAKKKIGERNFDSLDRITDDFNVCLIRCNIDGANTEFVSSANSGFGFWELGKLDPKLEQTTDIARLFIEERLKRPESIYRSPERWLIADKMQEFNSSAKPMQDR